MAATAHEAIARMKRTLEMAVVEGIRTTIPLHIKILSDPDFVAGRLNTHFMDRYQPKPKIALPRRERVSRASAELPRLYAIVDVEVAGRAGWTPRDLTARVPVGRRASAAAARQNAAGRRVARSGARAWKTLARPPAHD